MRSCKQANVRSTCPASLCRLHAARARFTAVNEKRNMFRLSIVCYVLVELMRVRTAVLTEPPETLAEKLDRLYEKLESITLAPVEVMTGRVDRHYAKLDRLNALNPENFGLSEDSLSDEDEELLSTLQQWAAVSPEQMGEFAKNLQLMRDHPEVERMKYDDADEMWNEDVSTYYLRK